MGRQRREMEVIEGMLRRIEKKSRVLSGGSNVGDEYRKRAEICSRVVNNSSDGPVRDRAVIAWAFWSTR